MELKKILAYVGIALGILTIILGLVISNMDNGAWQSMNVSFGGDFYTYSYEATARSANNIQAVADIVIKGFGYLLLSMGMFECCYFGIKLTETEHNDNTVISKSLLSIQEQITTVCDLLADIGRTHSDKNVQAMGDSSDGTANMIDTLFGDELAID